MVEIPNFNVSSMEMPSTNIHCALLGTFSPLSVLPSQCVCLSFSHISNANLRIISFVPSPQNSTLQPVKQHFLSYSQLCENIHVLVLSQQSLKTAPHSFFEEVTHFGDLCENYELLCRKAGSITCLQGDVKVLKSLAVIKIWRARIIFYLIPPPKEVSFIF